MYIVVGKHADCGRPCVEYHMQLEELIAKEGLQNNVLLVNEFLGEVGGSVD